MKSKYNTIFVKKTARTVHLCSNCGIKIQIREDYYNEENKDPYLNGQLIDRKNLCKVCYKMY
jgi:hypothetical protein